MATLAYYNLHLSGRIRATSYRPPGAITDGLTGIVFQQPWPRKTQETPVKSIRIIEMAQFSMFCGQISVNPVQHQCRFT
ncbi:MAG: hypothetical protein EPN14_03385 [Gallionella sp.]|nr:MAG: hypothetical protein EPN14_03385 [Gallionella sp.]